jgi:hypothetical protein
VLDVTASPPRVVREGAIRFSQDLQDLQDLQD